MPQTLAEIALYLLVLTIIIVAVLYNRRRKKIKENLECERLGMPPKHNLHHVSVRLDYVLITGVLIVAIIYCINLNNKLNALEEKLNWFSNQTESDLGSIRYRVNNISDIVTSINEANEPFSTISLSIDSIDENLIAKVKAYIVPNKIDENVKLNISMLGNVVEDLEFTGSIIDTTFELDLKGVECTTDNVVISIDNNGSTENHSYSLEAICDNFWESLGVFKLYFEYDDFDHIRLCFEAPIKDSRDAKSFITFFDKKELTKEGKIYEGYNTITYNESNQTDISSCGVGFMLDSGLYINATELYGDVQYSSIRELTNSKGEKFVFKYSNY